MRSKMHTRGQQKRADYVLYYKPNLPIAVIEAKDNINTIGDGMQQALTHAETLDVPFVFSSNGDAILSTVPAKRLPSSCSSIANTRMASSPWSRSMCRLMRRKSPSNIIAKYHVVENCVHRIIAREISS